MNSRNRRNKKGNKYPGFTMAPYSARGVAHRKHTGKGLTDTEQRREDDRQALLAIQRHRQGVPA